MTSFWLVHIIHYGLQLNFMKRKSHDGLAANSLFQLSSLHFFSFLKLPFPWNFTSPYTAEQKSDELVTRSLKKPMNFNYLIKCFHYCHLQYMQYINTLQDIVVSSCLTITKSHVFYYSCKSVLCSLIWSTLNLIKLSIVDLSTGFSPLL